MGPVVPLPETTPEPAAASSTINPSPAVRPPPLEVDSLLNTVTGPAVSALLVTPKSRAF